MEKIIANATLGLLMILFQDTDPILTVLVPRFVICGVALAGLIWIVGYVIHDLKEWFS